MTGGRATRARICSNCLWWKPGYCAYSDPPVAWFPPEGDNGGEEEGPA